MNENLSNSPSLETFDTCFRTVLVHFGELILKGKNRGSFVEKLFNSVRANLRGLKVSTIENVSGKIVVEFADTYPVKILKDRLSKVFGVAGFAFAVKTDTTLANIESTVISCLSDRQFLTFAVRAKRHDKKLPYTSQEVNERIGLQVLKFTGRQVNLDNPDVTIRIDMFSDRSYIYVDKFVGAGGLPVGSSGRVLSLISGGIDSPVASWRMMRRGCIVDFLHFHSAPFTDSASIEKVEEIVRNLNSWQMDKGGVVQVPFGNLQKKIVTAVPEKYRVILYRRFMFRLAEIVAGRLSCSALVTGESLGQVASQTLSNMTTVESIVDLPVLRPLVGMDKQEITDTARKIGTYELSILPHKDCCQFLEPRNPVTHTTVEEMKRVEENLNVDELVKSVLKDIA